jgi:hypothetical protein
VTAGVEGGVPLGVLCRACLAVFFVGGVVPLIARFCFLMGATLTGTLQSCSPKSIDSGVSDPDKLAVSVLLASSESDIFIRDDLDFLVAEPVLDLPLAMSE